MYIIQLIVSNVALLKMVKSRQNKRTKYLKISSQVVTVCDCHTVTLPGWLCVSLWRLSWLYKARVPPASDISII